MGAVEVVNNTTLSDAAAAADDTGMSFDLFGDGNDPMDVETNTPPTNPGYGEASLPDAVAPNPGDGSVSSEVVATAQDPPISDDFDYWPYSACTLSGYSVAECTVCKAPLAHLRQENPALDPFFCALCGFVDCRSPDCKPAEVGVLSAKHVHEDYLHKWGNIVKARTLFLEMLHPFDPKATREPDDIDALSIACALWNATRVMRFDKPEQEATFYHHLRMNPYRTLGVADEVKEDDPERPPTLMEMGSLMRSRLDATSLGEPFMDLLFGALVFKTQLPRDQFAQLAHAYNTSLDCITRLRMDVAGIYEEMFMKRLRDKAGPNHNTAANRKAMRHKMRLERTNIRQPYRVLNPRVSKQYGYVCPEALCKENLNGVHDPFVQKLLLGELKTADVSGNQSLNVAWLFHLIHHDEDEAAAILCVGKYKLPNDKPTDPGLVKVEEQFPDVVPPNPAPVRHRPASTQILLRLMGSTKDPLVLVTQMHSTLYTVEQWLSGQLTNDNTASMAREDLGGTAAEFDILGEKDPAFDKRYSKETFFSSVRKHRLEHRPRLAQPQLKGVLELKCFAAAIDVLCNPNVTPEARVAAYLELTGVIWPRPLNPFSAIMLRAVLTA
jgi:hypothetical protein